MPPAHKLPLSVTLITLNAGSVLDACLTSVAFADEIVILDSGSSDATLEIAARHGARVIHQAWLGYGPQKQAAVMAAKHELVLCLDADERVSAALAESIVKTVDGWASSGNVSPSHAWRMARANRFMGRYLKHGEGYPDWSLRLFDRRHARWSEDAVHEKVLTAGAVNTLDGDLLHDSAETLESYLTKQNRYTSLQADAMFKAGERASLLRMLLSPLTRFIKFYFVKLGVLDGLPGLVHICIGCMNSFVKYAKLRELWRDNG